MQFIHEELWQVTSTDIFYTAVLSSETILKSSSNTSSKESWFVCPHTGTGWGSNIHLLMWPPPKFLARLHLRLWRIPCSAGSSKGWGDWETPAKHWSCWWVTPGMWGALQGQTLSCWPSGFLMKMQCMLSKHKWWSFSNCQWSVPRKSHILSSTVLGRQSTGFSRRLLFCHYNGIYFPGNTSRYSKHYYL